MLSPPPIILVHFPSLVSKFQTVASPYIPAFCFAVWICSSNKILIWKFIKGLAPLGSTINQPLVATCQSKVANLIHSHRTYYQDSLHFWLLQRWTWWGESSIHCSIKFLLCQYKWDGLNWILIIHMCVHPLEILTILYILLPKLPVIHRLNNIHPSILIPPLFDCLSSTAYSW